jgi:hypothetical protein
MVGEHIRALKGGRWIHAIDCGDETVLHLVEDAAPPRVRRAYRPEFVAGAESVEHVTHRERTFAPKEVVRRAYSRATDPALAAMFGDSQAFAEWCITGRVVATRNVAVAVPGIAPAPPAARNGARKTPPVRAPSPKRSEAAEAKPAAKAKAAARAGTAKRRAASKGKPAAKNQGRKKRAPKKSAARAAGRARPVKWAKRKGARR